MKTYPSIKLSQLIDELTEMKKKHGDIPVVLAKDEEGNGFGTISEEFEDDSCSVQGGILVLWPYAENKELDEIEGYIESDDDETDYDYEDDDDVEPLEFDCD